MKNSVLFSIGIRRWTDIRTGVGTRLTMVVARPMGLGTEPPVVPTSLMGAAGKVPQLARAPHAMTTAALPPPIPPTLPIRAALTLHQYLNGHMSASRLVATILHLPTMSTAVGVLPQIQDTLLAQFQHSRLHRCHGAENQ